MKLWLAPAGLHIEPAETGDAAGFAELHAEAFFRGWPDSDFESYLLADDIAAFIACDPRRHPAGFAFWRVTTDEAELLTIVVASKWRGKGVGGALLRAAFEDLPMRGARRMFLEVDETNETAIRLYRGFGFSPVGSRHAYYAREDGTAATALVMGLELA
jgi:ribosomal-protein-alanine N-acetyltransferase